MTKLYRAHRQDAKRVVSGGSAMLLGRQAAAPLVVGLAGLRS